MHRPQPIHNISEMKEILEAFVTSIQILPVLLTGHVFAQFKSHFFGLHLSGLTIAIRSLSVSIFILFY